MSSDALPGQDARPSSSTVNANEQVESYLLPTRFYQDTVEHRVPYSSRSRGIRRGVKTRRWGTEKELGRGGFGVVHLQREEKTNKVRAVKEVLRTTAAAIDPLRELAAMAAMSKDEANFVKLYGWYQNETHLFIAMEYFQLGDLRDHIQAPLQEPDAQSIMYQITEALDFMHSRNFAHRDLKPSNIFVAEGAPNWWVKVADFGISKRHHENTQLYTLLSGDSEYSAPELMGFTDETTVTNAVDMWSTGCLTAWLLIQDVLLKPQNMFSFSTDRFTLPVDRLTSHGASDNCIAFVLALLRYRASERLTAVAALEHPWLVSSVKVESEDGSDDTSVRSEGSTTTVNTSVPFLQQTRNPAPPQSLQPPAEPAMPTVSEDKTNQTPGRPYPRQGRTKLPKALAEESAILAAGYTCSELDDRTWLIPLALSAEQIDGLIQHSEALRTGHQKDEISNSIESRTHDAIGESHFSPPPRGDEFLQRNRVSNPPADFSLVEPARRLTPEIRGEIPQRLNRKGQAKPTVTDDEWSEEEGEREPGYRDIRARLQSKRDSSADTSSLRHASSSDKARIDREDSVSPPAVSRGASGSNHEPVDSLAEDNRPVYIKCKVKYLFPATLDKYGLPWTFDPDDSTYVIIKQFVPHKLQEELFQHTKMLRRRGDYPQYLDQADLSDDRRERERNYQAAKAYMSKASEYRNPPSLGRAETMPISRHAPARSRPDEPRATDSIHDQNRPIWIRCKIEHLAPETLDRFQLRWDFDLENDGYLIIKQYVPETYQELLFQHTKQLRESRRQDLGCADSSHIENTKDGPKVIRRKSITEAEERRRKERVVAAQQKASLSGMLSNVFGSKDKADERAKRSGKKR